MGFFFDPDRPWQLQKRWRPHFLGFVAILAAAWGAYELYVNTYPRNFVTAWAHVTLLIVTAPFFLAGAFALQRRHDRARRTSSELVAAERRSQRIGLIGLLLFLAALGILYLSSKYLGRTLGERLEVMLLWGVFGLPGILLMFYSQTVDTGLSVLPEGLSTEDLDALVREKTSVGRFARGVLLFMAGMAALIGMLWYFPGIMAIHPAVIVGAIVVPVFVWTFVKVRRRQRERAAHRSPPLAQTPPMVPAERTTAIERLQLVLVAVGIIWAYAISDFFPGPAVTFTQRYLPIAGLVGCLALAGVLRLYSVLRSRSRRI